MTDTTEYVSVPKVLEWTIESHAGTKKGYLSVCRNGMRVADFFPFCDDGARMVADATSLIDVANAASLPRDEDDDVVGCESCDNADLKRDDAIYSGGVYLCPNCTEEMREVIAACEHALEPYVDEHGDDCQCCTKCSGLFYDDKDEPAAPEQAAPSPWKDIESAPKNGRRIIVYRECHGWRVYGIAYWVDTHGISGWVPILGFSDPPDVLGLSAPTHYMLVEDLLPLPTPPADGGKE